MKRYLLKSKKLFFINVFFVILSSFLYTALAFVLKALIDVSTEKDMTRFTKVLTFTVIYIFIILITTYIRKIFLAKYIKFNVITLRNDVFKKIISRSKKDFSSKNTANYISIINNDIEILQRNYFFNFLFILQAACSFIIACAGLVKLNVFIAIAILTLSLIPVAVPYIFAKKLSVMKKRYSDNLSQFIKIAKDFLSGFEVIKSFNIQNKIYAKYNEFNNELESSRYKFSKFNAGMSVIVDAFSYAAQFSAYGIGAYLIIKEQITVGTFVAAIQLMEFISAPVRNISGIIGSFKSVKLISKKVMNIIDEKIPEERGTHKESFEQSIEFKDVSFSYVDGKETLKDITFSINKGEKYAIVGKSGSGKSTILKLLLRYYDEYTGEILIDRLNNKEIESSSIYNLISVIQQDVFMFDTTIKENIALFENYDTDTLNRTFQNSGLSDFINSLERKENSHIGENGSSISGGEKQRVALARALIRNTPILALDEATASLDNETSFTIEKSLLEMKDITLLVVTHKLSEHLLKEYNNIIVLKDGVIEEMGTFKELINNKGYFYNLYTLEELS
ncbi:ABC transporter ATP-binding protein [Oceanirhabdus sp. W0125-5]|uniref:ABC transporter ATP-binding protein n=1 Tax=Oceanirhabdus sp. W0125-5 TaxID=2999116 RepID=UPI0022F2C616|nr:ABC transporter ATP-binding protein [Oceanirhabdus sp. W0125-5]WBW96297.1 ABC transporter ATP-binding protein [Oceanirhabdus sp. W0125-5]